MYPNVGAAGCGLVGAGGMLGLRPRGSGFALAARASPLAARAARSRSLLYEFVLYNLYTICIQNVRIGTKITPCTNWYYTICITIVRIRLYEFVQKLVKKDLHPGWDFNPGPIWLAIVTARTPPHPIPHFIYIPYNKNTIRKMRLYKFICMA